MKEIMRCERVGSEIEILFEGDENPTPFGRLFGGISWPVPESKGYFLILGESAHLNAKMKRPSIVLCEGESDLPEDLYRKIVEGARRVLCWSFGADINDQTREFYYGFDDFARRQDLSRISVERPAFTDWNSSLLSIRQKVKDQALIIPTDSILFQQLSRMIDTDRNESRKAAFWAVNGLRCALGGALPQYTVRVPAEVPVSDYFY